MNEFESKKEIIKQYFQSWIDNKISVIEEYFSLNIIYSECYGPEYNGKEQVTRWFNDWQEENKVLRWDIKRFFWQNNAVIVEWFFECETPLNKHSFDGVSIIEFDTSNKITTVKEFQSKAEHYFPYT
ncbi:MAG: nuclear transport factor 2 family protein [Treponema sp.]|jgi:hypothetical protein|nr:nuclear transport factor 2 family protein [Treponema sp.]